MVRSFLPKFSSSSERRLLALCKNNPGDDPDIKKWNKNAVQYLVKKLKKNLDIIDELEKAISQECSNTKCVPVPKTVDNRLLVSHRRCLPQVIFCRLWRWPDLQSHHQIRAISNVCERGAGERASESSTTTSNHNYHYNNTHNSAGLHAQTVCINPYHYERKKPDSLEPVLVPCGRGIPPDLSTSFEDSDPTGGSNRVVPMRDWLPTTITGETVRSLLSANSPFVTAPNPESVEAPEPVVSSSTSTTAVVASLSTMPGGRLKQELQQDYPEQQQPEPQPQQQQPPQQQDFSQQQEYLQQQQQQQDYPQEQEEYMLQQPQDDYLPPQQDYEHLRQDYEQQPQEYEQQDYLPTQQQQYQPAQQQQYQPTQQQQSQQHLSQNQQHMPQTQQQHMSQSQQQQQQPQPQQQLLQPQQQQHATQPQTQYQQTQNMLPPQPHLTGMAHHPPQPATQYQRHHQYTPTSVELHSLQPTVSGLRQAIVNQTEPATPFQFKQNKFAHLARAMQNRNAAAQNQGYDPSASYGPPQTTFAYPQTSQHQQQQQQQLGSTTNQPTYSQAYQPMQPGPPTTSMASYTTQAAPHYPQHPPPSYTTIYPEQQQPPPSQQQQQYPQQQEQQMQLDYLQEVPMAVVPPVQVCPTSQAGGYYEPVAGPSSSSIPTAISIDFQEVPFVDATNWCSISYHEYDHRVGEKYNPSSFIVSVDGFTHPLCSNRYCIGGLSNVNRNEFTEWVRRRIGKGVKFTYVDGEVYVENLCETSVFVCSPIMNYVEGQDKIIEVVVKVPHGSSLKVFSNSQFSKLLSKAVIKGCEAVYKLTNYCVFRLSFVKGWGRNYKRPSILNAPCWIEVQLNGPLQWIDKVLRQMRPPQGCGSTS